VPALGEHKKSLYKIIFYKKYSGFILVKIKNYFF